MVLVVVGARHRFTRCSRRGPSMATTRYGPPVFRSIDPCVLHSGSAASPSLAHHSSRLPSRFEHGLDGFARIPSRHPAGACQTRRPFRRCRYRDNCSHRRLTLRPAPLVEQQASAADFIEHHRARAEARWTAQRTRRPQRRLVIRQEPAEIVANSMTWAKRGSICWRPSRRQRRNDVEVHRGVSSRASLATDLRVPTLRLIRDAICVIRPTRGADARCQREKMNPDPAVLLGLNQSRRKAFVNHRRRLQVWLPRSARMSLRCQFAAVLRYQRRPKFHPRLLGARSHSVSSCVKLAGTCIVGFSPPARFCPARSGFP